VEAMSSIQMYFVIHGIRDDYTLLTIAQIQRLENLGPLLTATSLK
jgi:hypothetical protein